MTWLVLGVLITGFGTIGFLRIKEALRESLPDELLSQFEKKAQADSSPLSGHRLQSWKKTGSTVKVGCRLLERATPHRPALELRGEFEIGAGPGARNGRLKAQFDGNRLALNLKGRTVEILAEDDSLATLNLDSGDLETGGKIIGHWNMRSHLKGPGDSDYLRVRLQETDYYLCSRPGAIKMPGEKVYSPLLVGDFAALTSSDHMLLVGLGALWHGVLTNG